MPRQNRVTPFGEIISTPARGMFMGNRGILHDDEQRIQRPYRGQGWVICRLEHKGRRRKLMQPGRYTELFFLDEVTALAAGHRPCASCRPQAFSAFKAAWAAANWDEAREGKLLAKEMDRRIHKERVRWGGKKVTYETDISTLPDGTFIAQDQQALLLWDGQLWPWSPAGYGQPEPQPSSGQVTILTPRSTVAALAAGYAPARPINLTKA